LIDKEDMLGAENKIKMLYRVGKHFTDEMQLNKDGGLYEVYNTMYDISKQHGLYTKSPKEIFKKLSDVNYITTLINKSKSLESFFKESYNLNTERLNNFTFKFKSKVNYNQTPEMVIEKFNNKA